MIQPLNFRNDVYNAHTSVFSYKARMIPQFSLEENRQVARDRTLTSRTLRTDLAEMPRSPDCFDLMLASRISLLQPFPWLELIASF